MNVDNGASNAPIVRPGDGWTEHFRGTRYHFNANREVWWQLPQTLTRVNATKGHEDLVGYLLNLKPAGGSFRITESGAVVTKSQEDSDDWEPLYVCEYLDTLEFEQVNVRSPDLEPLDLWPAFYDGARYTYARGDIWWRNVREGLRQRATQGLPDHIEQRFRQVKPHGGSLRITEHGKVLTLIQPQPMPARMEAQYEALTNAQKRLVQVKVVGTNMLPIYLGDYAGEFTLQPPERLTDPLSDEDEERMVSFLKEYGGGVKGTEDPLDFADDRPEVL